MPGMENGAPERTETSSGSSESPSFLPMRSSRSLRYSSISSRTPSGHTLPALEYATQVWQVIVNPGGTGRPMLAISARLAPLPPVIHLASATESPATSVTLFPLASKPKR